MSPGEHDPAEKAVRIRRILVALDASARSREALESAAELASRWRAELLGLFVEDTDLLRLAAAASATHFLFPAASEETLSGMLMERELKALAEAARREVARAAAHSHVSWSFRIVRGRLPAEILLAAAQADLLSLSLGGAGRPMGRRLGFGPTLGRAEQPTGRPSPVLAVCDGSEGAVEACRFAAQLAESYGSLLTVLLHTPSGHPDAQAAAAITALIGAPNLRIRFRAIRANDTADFLRAVQSEAGGVLVLSGRSPLLREEMIEALMRETDKPVLIVGGRPGPAPGGAVAAEPPAE